MFSVHKCQHTIEMLIWPR